MVWSWQRGESRIQLGWFGVLSVGSLEGGWICDGRTPSAKVRQRKDVDQKQPGSQPVGFNLGGMAM